MPSATANSRSHREFGCLLLVVALLGAAPLFAQQSALDVLVASVAQKIAERHKNKALVADFVVPKDGSNELGRWLAERFSAALEQSGTGIEVLPGSNFRGSRKGEMGVSPEAQEGTPAQALAKMAEIPAGAEILVAGELKPHKGEVRLKVRVWEIPRWNGKRIELRKASKLLEVSAKIPMTGEMQALLDRSSSAGFAAGESDRLPKYADCANAQMLGGAEKEAGSESAAQVYKSGVGGVGFPQCVACPSPEFSREARKRKLEGTVSLEVTITPEGMASDFCIVKRAGGGLDEKAIEAVRAWRFKPAMGPGGRPVPVRTRIEVTFRIAKSGKTTR